MLNESFVSLLRCPASKQMLELTGAQLLARDGSHRYRIAPGGIPVFAEIPETPEAKQQQAHYDGVCKSYLENLTYPHTQEYFAYLDRALFDAIGPGSLGCTLEVCCGRGEALRLCGDRIEAGVGIDISLGMLQAGRPNLPTDRFALLQGDATRLPIRDEAFDTVMTFGGIHHVNDRLGMFSEAFRVLKPGGRFIWREPVSDFWLWRTLRAIIYRLSPALDADTERPLRHRDTVPVLETAGFTMASWRTFGFAGFCLFMNSDVLIFNRLFRFVPGIRGLTRLFANIDDWITARHLFRNVGLQVIGVAQKPFVLAGTGAPLSATGRAAA